MNATEAPSEAALESAQSSPEPTPTAEPQTAVHTRVQAAESEPAAIARPDHDEAEGEDDSASAFDDPPSEALPEPPATDIALEKLDRRKLEEQLEALKRKENELRRALTLADHPSLAEAVRVLEGRIYAVARVEAKLAQGPSKSEARRRETIGKKLSVLQEKRAELDAQIGQLEAELSALGADRTQVHEGERREALEQLMVSLSSSEGQFQEAGIEVTTLVPDLVRLLPEVIALAEGKVAARDAEA